MITAVSTRALPADSRRVDPIAVGSARFEWTLVLFTSWIVAGAHLDAWAHRHVGRLETFFTPWHAVLYAGVLATGTYLFIHLLRGRQAGRPWLAALPRGYGLSFVGFVLFGIGGTLDLAWHTIFGIERNYAASLSPTHLILYVSGALMVTGGLRAAWASGQKRLGYPGLFSATLLLSLLIFFGQDLHPFTSQWSAAGSTPSFLMNDQGEELGVVEVILQSGVLMGVVLFLIGRFTLPRAALTILMTLTTAAIVVIWKPDPIVVIGITGGVFGDVLRATLRPSTNRPWALRAFAFLLPSVTYLLYFLGIQHADGTWWPVHVWTGAIVAAGLTGLLVSFLVHGLGVETRLVDAPR